MSLLRKVRQRRFPDPKTTLLNSTRLSWDSNARDNRTIDVIASRVAVLLMAGGLGTALAGSARAADCGATVRGNCGPVLCISAARGWFGSVGPGVVEGRAAAWLLNGNFYLSADAAEHEGTPTVPPGKLLISFSDFPVVGRSLHWPRVKRLRLPQRGARQRVIAWHIRFGGRAVSLSVHFGSPPDGASRRLANLRLSGIHRDRG
jgi:hypothetical protein